MAEHPDDLDPDPANHPAPARTVAELVDAGASPAAVVALVRLGDVLRRLQLLEAELDRHALQPLTDARFRELVLASAVLEETARC